MKDWIFNTVDYFLSNWQELLWGGACAVGLVIFILGCIKPWIKKWITNDTLRKVVLAWLSVILNVPMTTVSVWVNKLPTEHFWTFIVLNVVGTIIVYFLYENTALRNGLHWLGKKIFTAVFLDTDKKSSVNEIRKEAEDLLAGKKADTATAKYNTNSRYNNNINV